MNLFHDFAAQIGRLCIGTTSLIFLLAGVSKLLQPKPLVRAIRDYRLLPPVLVPLAALSLPVMEISLGLAMLRLGHSRVVAGLCAALLVAFASAMSVNLLRGRGNISCGCGFSGKRTISWSLVFRNVGLAGVAFGGTSQGLFIACTAVLLSLLGATVSAKLVPSPAPSHANS